jgi:type IV pilus assembly protein PilZ
MAKLSLQDFGLSKAVIGSERRGAQRAELMVQIEYSTVDEMFSEFTRDINEGGLFIETNTPRPVGTEITLRFALPGGEGVIETSGLVVRSSAVGHGDLPGMGVEFDELSAADRVKIDRIVRSLRSVGRRH